MGRAVVRAVVAVVVAAAAVAGVLMWGERKFTGPGPLTQPTTVIIERGTSQRGVAERLAEYGVIGAPLVFVIGVRFFGGGKSLRAGEYAFATGVSGREVLDKLTRGEVVARRLTVPEGLTTAQVVALLTETEGLIGEIEGTPPEDALLPETFHFSYGDSRSDVLRRMESAMGSVLDELWAGRASDLPFDRPAEALILASIVEKETGVATERARVAGVFINRLKRGMPLQSDPTVVYALTAGAGPLGRPLSRADLATDSPYNTYLHKGLPPGPIANPGRAAIAAVLHPEATDELFFVADGSGGHLFARTLAGHNRNVARRRARLKEAAEGGDGD